MLPNILSVDVEEWFHPEALQHLYPKKDWDNQETRVTQNVHRLLELFSEKGAQATFFVLGWIARKYPKLIRDIVDAGHEVASHSNEHRMVTKLTPDEFRADLKESIKILEDISGRKVLGFRAPTFSVVKETLWALDIMLELGLKYDSSIYPIWHDRYGIPDAPRKPYIAREKNGSKLTEFPMPTLQIAGKNMPFGGGGYLRIFPLLFTQKAIRHFNGKQSPAIIYMHPWEFDSEQPRLQLGLVQTWRHYYNINRNLNKLAALLEDTRWTSFRGYIEDERLMQKIIQNH